MRIALHGPMYSGKTTLARKLESAHGFTLVNYTDYLKSLAVKALNALGQLTSVEEIAANKTKYRPFLQDLGTLLDFDGGKYVGQCLFEQSPICLTGDPLGLPEHIVFDNVRTLAQLDILKKYGFRLLRLGLSPDEQRRRAAELGVSQVELDRLSLHSIERAIPTQRDELWLYAGRDADELAQELADGRAVAFA
jgi:hypothetical protein